MLLVPNNSFRGFGPSPCWSRSGTIVPFHILWAASPGVHVLHYRSLIYPVYPLIPHLHHHRSYLHPQYGCVGMVACKLSSKLWGNIRKLKHEVEKVKRTLSSQQNMRHESGSSVGGNDFSGTLTHTKFEELIVGLFRKTMKPVVEVSKDANLRKEDVDEVCCLVALSVLRVGLTMA